MRSKTLKMASCCIIGALALTTQPIIAKAFEVPVTGINVVINNMYIEEQNNFNIYEYLTDIEESEFLNLGIAKVRNYVNIRNKPSEEGNILGKLYNHSAATILAEENGWYQVASGSVTGYIKAEFLVTGDEVKELAKTVGKRYATVNVTTLKVRSAADLNSSVVALAGNGETFQVEEELDQWIKISNNSGLKGYVYSEYVELITEFNEAISLEEEEAERRRQEQQNRASQSPRPQTPQAPQAPTQGKPSPSVNRPTNSSARSRIVEYALRFVGNPYVWGGTSLTRGADCSGFTQSVFRDNGIRIPRTSGAQSQSGRRVSIDNKRPGDLIFYTRNGSVNHVAIYIGNGKVVHASTAKTGIKISNYNYRTPYKIVNYID